ncbi:DUF4386 domain-containing protein [Aurantibacter crassamenti]|uniref:DUF4386 domain-containing protein n=1 Tax=Aurantibacter crassamenti TaxID=1837375 RepID=UPI00193A91A4|nr:DUF4386 domain-containing protein [Aurantibacter crassamenti]MBM1107042.1 DUF4386 domain-containing protein [Aurantibacter crassamenti]
MTSVKKARLAGFLYLIVVVTGIINLAYIPSKLIDWKSAAITFNNISANETLFRFGILSGLLCYTAFLLLPFALYKLLNTINKNIAGLMVILSVVSVPISLLNFNNKFLVLKLLDKAKNIDGANLQNIQEQVLVYLQTYNAGNQIAAIFWGLWLFPFGYLVYKSGFLPKILGALLMFGCVGYVINFVGSLLYPEYGTTIISDYITKPGSIGEIGICLWLLIVGVRKKKMVISST